MKIKLLKIELKEYAAWIKTSGLAFKEVQRGNKDWPSYHKECYAAKKFPTSYRHMHIAYCLLRGRKYEQIEMKVKEGNEPNWTQIENIMAQYRDVDAISDGDFVA